MHTFNWSYETGIQWPYHFEEIEFFGITLEGDMGKNKKLTQVYKVSTCSSRGPTVYTVIPQLTEDWACDDNANIQVEKKNWSAMRAKKGSQSSSLIYETMI